MIERLTETQTVWERLQTTKKPIVLYGMGDGALKIMEVFRRYHIPLAGIFASDEFVRGHSFAGFPVLSLSQVKEKWKDFVIVLAFGTFREPLLSYLYQLSERYEFYAPDVPAVLDGPIDGWCNAPNALFDLSYVTRHEEEFEKAYTLLSDERSRETFLSVLNYKISGKVSYLKQATDPREQVFDKLLYLNDQEDYVDLGAYNGDTVLEFLEQVNGCYRRIIALEPDRKNFKKLSAMVEKKELENIQIFHAGSCDKTQILSFSARSGRNSSLHGGKDGVMTQMYAVDDLLNGNRASLIKMDVEGAEERTILGCRKTIACYHPKLMISAYHRNSDLFSIPLLLQKIAPGYRIYLRHHPYIPAWETNYYCHMPDDNKN